MLEHLSNIELYFAPPHQFSGDKLVITGEEFRHAVKVMRHKINDTIYATDGAGNFFTCRILAINKTNIEAEIIEQKKHENKFDGIYFVIPKLKSSDRFEFALEKSVECGITNFIIFNAERSISKSNKIERWEKICLSAMKQSIRFFLPVIKTVDSLNEISDINEVNFVFEQNVDKKFVNINLNKEKKFYFIFGPEGGLSENELSLFRHDDLYNLSGHRLRSETAIIKCAGIIGDLI